MRDHQYTVGEIVFIVAHNGEPSRRTKVREVKDYKRGPKVICEDDSEWDVNAHCRWGSRSEPYYMGNRLAPYTDKLATAYATAVAKRRLQWALDHFDELNPVHQAAISKFLFDIKKEHKQA